MSGRRGTIDDAQEASGFEVVVLGSSGTLPGPGRAASGYLFRSPTTNIVVDMGHGSSANLYRLCPPERIDAVVLSHPHADHCVDLTGLYYALRWGSDSPGRVDVFAPPGTADFVGQLVGGDGPSPGFREVCRFHDIGAGDRVEVGDLAVEVHHSVHVVPAVSVRVSDGSGVATYSGDSAGGDDLVAAARDADLFLCEASWVGSADDYDDGVHLTAAGAGEVARDAGVGRLLLTHIWPTNDRDRVRREAEGTFGREVDLAEDGDVWSVGS